MLVNPPPLFARWTMIVERAGVAKAFRTAAIALTVLFVAAVNPAQAQKFTALYSFGVVDGTQPAPGG